VGLLIVSLGIIFLLDQQGIFPARDAFHFFWAAIIIFWGVQIVVHARSGSGQIWGTLVILVGATSLANELGFFHIRIVSLWPLALIAFGVWTLLHGTGRAIPGPGSSEWRDWGERVRSSSIPAESPTPSGPAPQDPDPGGAEFSQSVIFSGFKRRVSSQHFKYAKVASVFGGFNIDFTHADMDGDRAVIHVDAVFGGGEIRVPDAWIVKLETGAIGGAFVDETYPRSGNASVPTKQLIVRGTVIFGGVVIKN